MKFIITVRNLIGVRRYHAIGNLGDLIDAAYDDGALGVSVMVQP